MIYKQDDPSERTDGVTPRIIKTRQPLCWHYISALLESFRCTPAMRDKDFRMMFQSLYELVSKKIDLPNNGDIVDSYVIVEQSASEV